MYNSVFPTDYVVYKDVLLSACWCVITSRGWKSQHNILHLLPTESLKRKALGISLHWGVGGLCHGVPALHAVMSCTEMMYIYVTGLFKDLV